MKNNDPVSRFLEERVVERQDRKVGSTALFEGYKDWCEQEGEVALNHRNFGAELTVLGFTEDSGRKVKVKGKVYYKGIEILRHG